MRTLAVNEERRRGNGGVRRLRTAISDYILACIQSSSALLSSAVAGFPIERLQASGWREVSGAACVNDS